MTTEEISFTTTYSRLSLPFSKTVILGFDYDTKNLAYGIINCSNAFVSHCKYSEITDLFEIAEGVLKRWRPHFVAIEGLFLRSNPNSLIKLANIQGILRLAAYRFKEWEASIITITPEEAKRAIGIDVYRAPYKGSKTKEKKQLVIQAVSELLGIELVNEHQADALAVAWKLWKELHNS